jgi:hypothetical protein
MSFFGCEMTKSLIPAEEGTCDEIPINLHMQMRMAINCDEKERYEEVMVLNFGPFLRRIMVLDGIMKINFSWPECGFFDFEVWIPRTFEVLESSCFSDQTFHSSVVFGLSGRFHVKKSKIFAQLSRRPIMSRCSFHGRSCSLDCEPLLSVTIESNSRLIRIESKAFSESSLQSIVIPRNVLS